MTQDRESLIEEMTMAVGGVDDTIRHGDLRTCPACRARATVALDALLARLRDPSDERALKKAVAAAKPLPPG